jgi:glycosyltransferase involved in cell wall biosynthesis
VHVDGESHPVRILWLSNAPWAASGYGEQTAMWTTRFQALGHEVAIAANYGLHASTTTWQGMTVYPANEDWGNPTIATFAAHHKADVVIALCDAWVMKPDAWPDLEMAIWAPIDHYPIPPAVLAVLQHERVRPIAMSRDGEHWMGKFSLEPLYAPHGVDTSVFRPYPGTKAHARKALSVPQDAFLVGMVAANKGSPQFPRKSWPQAFDAFAQFAREHPDAYLYCHTQAEPRGHNGIDLFTLAKVTGCPEDRVSFPPEHAWHLGVMDSRFVASLYQAFDVLLNPSMGEGFGIPILEAQACGCPVIASDHSAMTELTQAGWLVKGDRWWDALQSSFAIVPSIASIHHALESAYEWRNSEQLRTDAVEFAQGYDADRVTELYWQPVLEELAKPREIPPLNGKSRQVRRAEARAKAKA